MLYDNDVLFSEWHRHTWKKEMWVLLSGVEPKTFTSPDALPLSYRRLVVAKAIKLGSWDILHTARIEISMCGIAYGYMLAHVTYHTPTSLIDLQFLNAIQEECSKKNLPLSPRFSETKSNNTWANG